MSDRLLARIIHENFYCNRRYAATTRLTAGGLTARSVNILMGTGTLLPGDCPHLSSTETGAAVMVGGCVLDAAGKGNGALCQLSVIGGAVLMRTAPAVMEGALRPDLRHWEHVPAAFVVTRASKPEPEPCLPKLGTAVQWLW